MRIKVVTSVKCGCCRNYCDSLRKVGFDVEEIDAPTKEGQEIISRCINRKGLPTIVVEVNDLRTDYYVGNHSAEYLKRLYL